MTRERQDPEGGGVAAASRGQGSHYEQAEPARPKYGHGFPGLRVDPFGGVERCGEGLHEHRDVIGERAGKCEYRVLRCQYPGAEASREVVDAQNTALGTMGVEPGIAKGALDCQPARLVGGVDLHHVALVFGVQRDQFVADDLGKGKGQETPVEICGADAAAIGSKQPVAWPEFEMFRSVACHAPAFVARSLQGIGGGLDPVVFVVFQAFEFNAEMPGSLSGSLGLWAVGARPARHGNPISRWGLMAGLPPLRSGAAGRGTPWRSPSCRLRKILSRP